MNLSQKLGRHFVTTVRNRGKSYFWQGRVRIRHGSDCEVKAIVRGYQTYNTSLDCREGGVLSLECTCAYFESNRGCKHLWATILAAEEDGYLSKAAAAKFVTLEYRSEGFSGELDEAGRESSHVPSDPRPPIPPPAPHPPAWRRHITAILDSRFQTAGHAKPWPAKGPRRNKTPSLI